MHEPDLARVVDVRAAAKFGAEVHAVVLDLYNANIVSVLVAEEGERPGLHRLAIAGGAPGNLKVVTHFFVRELLRLNERAAGRGFEVREVEAQPVRRDQRALLADVRAENRAQRGMQQVRAGVVTRRARPPREVDARMGRLRHANLAFGDPSSMDNCATTALCVFDKEYA